MGENFRLNEIKYEIAKESESYREGKSKTDKRVDNMKFLKQMSEVFFKRNVEYETL